MTADMQADQPIDPAIVQRASEWMARLWSGEASEADVAACAVWRAEHPDHELAWNRLQDVGQQLASLPRAAARRALLESPPSLVSRRRALQLFAGTAVLAGSAYSVLHANAWKRATADYRAATGEIRHVALPDGTQVILDTASAIDVRYTDGERRIVLRVGRIFITTAADPMPVHRPFLVECEQGTVRALGTQFTVQQDGDVAQVAVYQGAVEIRPRRGEGAVFRLDAGQRTVFSDRLVQPALAEPETTASWARGTLVAERMRVADLVEALSRYQTGILRCDDSAAEMRVTGVFPLLDIDRALNNLALGVPVEVVHHTRYWITVRARKGQAPA